jgi:hypothetical protein
MTNGTALLFDIDGRSAIARRFKDITSDISPTRAAPYEDRSELHRTGLYGVERGNFW